MQAQLPLTNPREIRGKAISEKSDQVRKVFDFQYLVKSQTSDREYEVMKFPSGWACNCPDYLYRGVDCKHIFACQFSFELRREVEVRKIEPIGNDSTKCIFCKSETLVKDGVRHNKYGDIQKFFCKNCHKYFTINVGFENLKHNPQAVTTAMQLYFSGESLRNTMKSLKLLGVQVSHSTVYRWIERYVSLMNEYLDKITPNISNTWRADEMYVKIRGNQKYLFALMDDETRFWIAQEVADTKDRHDASHLFKMGKEIAGKRPIKIITDGLQSYHDAWKKEFKSNIGVKTEHVRQIQLKGTIHNNKMERMNGEIRDREQSMRGLKNIDTPILKGYQIFHNYIRPHESLGNCTPSEACGLKIEGKDKWMTLIQNASAEA